MTVELRERCSMFDTDSQQRCVRDLMHDGKCIFTGQRVDAVDHPPHYGGADNPYEAIKVIEAWQLGFNLGNTVKYISRAGKKGDTLEDLRKAKWYLGRAISNLELGRDEYGC